MLKLPFEVHQIYNQIIVKCVPIRFLSISRACGEVHQENRGKQAHERETARRLNRLKKEVYGCKSNCITRVRDILFNRLFRDTEKYNHLVHGTTAWPLTYFRNYGYIRNNSLVSVVKYEVKG